MYLSKALSDLIDTRYSGKTSDKKIEVGTCKYDVARDMILLLW